MAEIHDRLQDPSLRFVLLGSAGEELKKPYEKAWQETANYQHDDPKISSHRGNVGICGGYGDLHILDCDDLSRWEELVVFPLIPATFTVESRPGHRQYYLRCPDHFQSGGLYDPERTTLNEAGKPEYVHIGDLKAGAKDGVCGGQAVAPGSRHPSGSAYQVVVDAPIADVSREHLQSIINKFRQSKKFNTNFQKAEEQVKNSRKLKLEVKDPLDSLHVKDIMPPAGETSQSGDELRGDHPIHGSTNGGNYVINLAKNVWHCKRCESGGGAAAAIAVKHGLISCSDAGPGELRGDLFREVLKIAKEQYTQTATSESKYDQLLNQIEAEPRKAGEEWVITQLAILKSKDPIGFDLFLNKFKKLKLGIKAHTITGMVDAAVTRLQEAMPNIYPVEEVPSDITNAAREILEHGDPLTAHQNYVTEKVCGGEKPARAVTVSAYSAYVEGDRLHSDVVGGAQSGKSTNAITALECFPDENVLIASEASPKALYYLAQQQPERLRDAIIYIDDARPDHIPVLKTFRNETSVRPTNITVADGEFLELTVQYRPTVIASAVTPLRDHEGQATSRAMLISVPDADEDEEKLVRTKIRQQIAISSIVSQKTDNKRRILQQMVRILRDEGTRNVAIPFDVKEPDSADRRGTGQFMRLIKVLAFINQFQRPIIEMQDGREAVLATYADFLTASKIWFDFAEGQEFKISPKAMDVLKALPDTWPGKSAPTISKTLRKGQRSIERYLEDLYEAGIASREKITAPGMPWGYWIEPEMRQKAMSQISEAEEPEENSVIIATTKNCRKYVAKNSPDSLKDSYIRFFSNSDIDIKKMYKGGKELTPPIEGTGGWIFLYTPLFSGKPCRNSEKGPDDSEIITTTGLSLLPETPPDIDSDFVANRRENVAIHGEEPQQAGAGPHPLRDAPTPPKLKAIYTSGGPALEYAAFSLNLHHGCTHDCEYCYARDRIEKKSREQYKRDFNVSVKKSSLKNIEADLMSWQGERKPVHLTFIGDPYDLGRQDNSDVRAVLELFKKYRHPFQTLTKGGTKAVQDFDLYGEGCRFGCTLTFNNDKDSLEWEPGAALPADRVAALKDAHARGISTWVSLEPVIDPAQTLALIEATHEVVDHYGVGKWNHDARADKIDWPKFRADAEAILKKYGKSYQIKEDLRKAAPGTAKVLFNTTYTTDWGGSMREFQEGEVAEVPVERAETWIKRGIVAAVVEAGA